MPPHRSTGWEFHMKTLYLNASAGICGDMAAAALLTLSGDDGLYIALASLGLSGQCSLEDTEVRGIRAKSFTVSGSSACGERTEAEIDAIIDRSALAEGAKHLAKKMFSALAQGEAAVHGIPQSQVHFHEVGRDQSILNLCAAAFALERIGADQVLCSEVCDGSGTVTCAHGTLPVPVPASLKIAEQAGIPLRLTSEEGEMVTPTGAAILAASVDRYGASAAGTVLASGYGAAVKKNGEKNLLRAILLDDAADSCHDRIVLLETNIDDSSPEVLGYVLKRLFQAGARDAWLTPIYMKKNRPACALSVICDPSQEASLTELLFRETGAIGLRRAERERVIMNREPVRVLTEYGPIDGKRCSYGSFCKVTPEYESACRAAEKAGAALQEVYQAFERGKID